MLWYAECKEQNSGWSGKANCTQIIENFTKLDCEDRKWLI